MRSKTAEELYKNDDRFIVKSAWVADFAEVPLSLELLLWADYIVVMEEMHLQWIAQSYPMVFSHKKDQVHSLDIPDRYDYMEPLLGLRVQQEFEALYHQKIKASRG